MRRALITLLLLAGSCAEADDWAQTLQRVREKVAQEIATSANYNCVQTVDRSYFRSTTAVKPGCAGQVNQQTRKEVMHDHLRLDIAVSEGAEIYSWHGENKFSASSVADVVRTGPISSGGFVGFLENIFLSPGVSFTYAGRASINGVITEYFQYTVPLAHTGFHIQTKHGEPLVPFHGSFSVNANDLQLTSLEVIPDDIPADSSICSAETEMKYQIAKISGKDSLIPQLFLLRLEDEFHTYTVSRSDYSECREFRGESTLRFNMSETAAETPAVKHVTDEPLPAGMTLRIGLRTPIDDRMSYTGDPVEGVLLDAVNIPGADKRIAKNAVLHGVITELECHYEPGRHYLIRVQFDRLSSGNDRFVLNAWPKQSRKEVTKLAKLYGWPLPVWLQEDFKKGLFVMTSGHFHFDQQFSAEWETRRLPDASASVSQAH